MPSEPGKLLFLNDRDIHDGLTSAKQQITTKMLREFFLDKGIFLPGKLSREKLINYISMLNLDYHDVQFLVEQLTPPSRKEKVRFIDLDCEANKAELREIVNGVKESRTDSYSESYQPQIIGDENRVVVNVEYDEIDLSKTRLRQRKHKEATIELEALEDNKVRIRFPDNSRAEDIATALQKSLRESKNVTELATAIDLSEIFSSRHRTEFFIKIISFMKEMTLANVTKVSVESRLPNSYALTEEDDSEEEAIDEEVVKGIVNKAVLSGSSVLASETYQELTKNNFYIYKLGWQMIERKANGNKLEFEAYFSDAPDCKKFSCQVVGVYRPRNSDFTVSRKRLTVEENKKYFSTLETAASKSFEEIVESYRELAAQERSDDDKD